MTQLVTEVAVSATDKRRTSLPSAEFEPAIPAVKWLKNYALDRTATGIGCSLFNDAFLKRIIFFAVLDVIMRGIQWTVPCPS